MIEERGRYDEIRCWRMRNAETRADGMREDEG